LNVARAFSPRSALWEGTWIHESPFAPTLQKISIRSSRCTLASNRTGLELTATVIAWSRRNGFSALVLNTTTPQAPARALYAGLGFREVCQSYLGHYELVWYELAL